MDVNEKNGSNTHTVSTVGQFKQMISTEKRTCRNN